MYSLALPWGELSAGQRTSVGVYVLVCVRACVCADVCLSVCA